MSANPLAREADLPMVTVKPKPFHPSSAIQGLGKSPAGKHHRPKTMTDHSPDTDIARIAFVGGYEPRLCGIATFTTDLCEAVAAAVPETLCIACAVNDRTEGYKYPPRVRLEMLEKDIDSYRRAA